MREFWKGLSGAARTGLVVCAGAILVATVVAAWWLLRTDYQVLFAGLSPQDAAAVTAELERQKIPFELNDQGEDGGMIVLVDHKDVYRTRLKVMGKDLPLHGAVGFELFNNSDFGMTEFAQRINYQRALQGELTRTILSLSEVRDARVLLALPEQGLFKRDRAKGTASITLTLKPGQLLSYAQVSGIQRLVAAAVPGIASQDVTIVDQSGVALSRPSGEGDAEVGAGRLDLKRDTEIYLARKATEVLDRALGKGEALATVDATLEMDRVQTTSEEVVAAPGAPGRLQTGVVVRERETVREVGGALGTQASLGAGPATPGGSSQREVEYAVGRRVEQVIGQPGNIRRLQVVAVVKKALDAGQQEQLRRLVAASVGAVADRGDTVVVQSIDALVKPTEGPAGSPGTSAIGVPAAGTERARRSASEPVPSRVPVAVAAGTVVLGLVVVLLVVGGALRRRRAAMPAPAPLTEAERKAALQQVQAWLAASRGATGPR